MSNSGIIIEEKGKRIELIVPHANGYITFVSPAKGRGSIAKVKEEVEHESLEIPTISETISLLYAALQNPQEKYSKEVIDARQLWANNGVLYVPRKGAYIQDTPEIREGRVSLNESELAKKLESGDKSVGFVPYGYKTGCHIDIKKNHLLRALSSDESVEKLNEIVRLMKFPSGLIFNALGTVTKSISSLVYLDYGPGAGAAINASDVCGNHWNEGRGYDYYCFSYGIDRSLQEVRPENRWRFVLNKVRTITKYQTPSNN